MDVLNTKIKSILTEKTLKARPENIKSGETIFGIAGNVVELQGETKSVTPTTSAQTITPSSGKNGITQVNVSAVTSAIDNNITTGNIKNGVSILGVAGTYQGNLSDEEYARSIELTEFILGDSDYYTELEYIQSTGTQYINTNFNPDGNTKIECKWTDGASNGVIFGAYNGAWDSGYGLYGNEQSGQKYWRHYFSNDDTNLSRQSTMVVVMDKGTLTVNGNVIISTANKTNSVSYPMYIFGGNWSGARLEQPSSIKLHYFKIYDNNVLVKDFVPVKRNLDDVICLYDRVSSRFYTNNGTGTFIAGPVVEEE